MRTRRGKAGEDRNPLARLRMDPADPDPDFRAVLRERLVAAAAVHSEDHRNCGRRAGADKHPD